MNLLLVVVVDNKRDSDDFINFLESGQFNFIDSPYSSIKKEKEKEKSFYRIVLVMLFWYFQFQRISSFFLLFYFLGHRSGIKVDKIMHYFPVFLHAQIIVWIK